ncbi:type I polyketide synthase [Streptomyces aculeolatus]|uniref:type I polyketide synthase n=1 Tax=Streptomyces aculeolatus TaxID=270689 RepID=UPI0027E1BF40|nr:type I polyketide synthase [Streptomyces aculeolatus]
MPADRRIAVVGMACRVPGAADPGAFWRLLRDGVDAVGPAPAGRGLPEGAHGGFLDEVDRFDAAFFGMSPREAAAVDPQQRLALELAWEALEHAGLRPGLLRGSRTGVFVGAMTDDYARLQHAAGAVSAHSTTGLSRAALANRLSHVLGLTGPSLAVDTAQSSGLAAVHLAVRSLLDGESTLAVAGGVQLNILAEGFAAAELFGALAPGADARCRVFDARADGYVRGEGGGIVVLKPLAAALADGDPVHGVILGSALGSGTGRTLTAPDPAAQESVIRAAYRDAGVDPDEARYVELHGTGTPMGDPVEAAALAAALGTAHRGEGEELVVGSVKTNIGHLEGAAGAVGLIKALLSLKHGELPPSLHFEEPHPRIPLDELKLRVRTGAGPWPRERERRAAQKGESAERLVAGVSSFGMGGTNCHVVLSDWRPAPGDGHGEGDGSYGTLPWLVSGRGAKALRAQAAALAAHVTGTEPDRVRLPDLAGSLATTRSAFEHRAVVLGGDREALLSGLAALADGRDTPHVLRGAVAARPAPDAPGGRVAFLFSGQGSQRAGMGRALYAAFPAYAEAFDAVCAALDARLARHLPDAPPLRDVVLAGPDTPEAELLGRTVFTQPALFAVEVSLCRLLERWGVTPDVLLGHSVGELAAAHVAGVLDLADAAALVTARGALMQALPADGAMAAIEADEAELRADLAAYEEESGPGRRVAIAALNGPAETVVSGDADAVRELTAAWSARGRKATALRVSHAFHSPHMDGMLDAFRRVAEGLTYHPPRIRVVSDLTGAPAGAAELCSPDYWVRHVREAVRFLDGARAASAAGATVFVEIGPGAALSGLTRDCLGDDAGALVLPTLRRDAAEDRSLLTTLGELHVHGAEVGWDAFFADAGARRVELPTYRFQRSRHWTGQSPPVRPAAGELPGAPDAPPAPAEAAEPAEPADEQPPADIAGLTDLVRTHTAAALGYDSAAAVSTGTAFRDLGLDSYGAVELRRRLTAGTGVRLPSGALFNHPTPAAMAAWLHTALGGGDARPEPDAGPAPAAGDDDPVVIVGMACRYPGGVGSPAELWRLLREERDAIGDFPADRGWDLEGLHDPDPDRAGTSYTARGGFLDDVAGFDAEFFGISPREALAMDPQQRLLLETSWEAFERAGIAAGPLRGSRTGVFVGATAQDYGPRMHEAADGLEGYVLTGTTPSVASGRIAYVFGLEGPAVTVDTACSSSLVALHLAAQSIRAGECDTALAGGVTVLSTPGMFVEFSRQRGLAADGRCKPFAAGADGTGWAEGVGVLVLERLSVARRNGHRPLAVVRGTAINQDGASNGLTAPNGLAQERVISAALASAGLGTRDVDAVEAHGTGTELGDPIEAEALLATYGQGRAEDRPVWLGSLKSNIGHTQAAAGVAGIIKMVQAMQHGELPATLHVDEPTPHVEWAAGGVSLLTRARPWPEVDRPRRAAVSSFGVSGTNAHVILEQADETGPAETPETPGVAAWPLTGRTAAALRAHAKRLHDYAAERPELRGDEVAAALVRRTRFDRRAVVVGAGRAELLAGLEALAAGVPHDGVVQGTAAGPGKTVFVYPGQGSQWVRMGARLLAESPVFADALADCARALSPHVHFDLLDVLTSDDPAVLEPVEVVQPALWAVMVALTRWWEHHGVRPDAVIGHSQGEIAAAHVAGALSLEDAARVVAQRSQALTALAGTGGMLSVALDEAGAEALLGACGVVGEVSVAAYNGPAAVVVAGPAGALDAVQEHCVRNDVRHRRVPVTYASHTALVQPLEADLAARLEGIEPRTADIPFYSTVSAGPVDTTTLTADYWFTNLRSPVRFHQTVQALLADGYGHFVEPSPHPGLLTAVEDTIDAADAQAVTHATLHRNDDTPHRLALALAHAHAHGLDAAFDAAAPPADLPTYPFQHQHLWLSPAATAPAASAGRHLFLGAPVPLATSGGLVFTAEVSLATHPWLADHAVAGTVLLPGTALVELALHAADHVGCDRVDELTLSAPLLLPAAGAVRLQVTVDAPDAEGRRALGVHARPAADEEAPWTAHAEGVLARTADASATGLPWPPPATAAPVDLSDGYPRLGARGYDYGPVFQGLRRLWHDGADGTVFAEVALPDEATADADRAGVHPALFDAALHAVLLGAPSDRTLLPFSWSGVRLHATRATSLRVRASRLGDDAVALVMTDPAGDPVVTVDRLSLRPVEAARLREAAGGRHDGLYRVAWRPLAPGPERADHVDIADLADLSVLPVPVPESVVIRPAAVPADAAPDAAAIRASVARALELVQGWLGDERFDGSRLVFVTGGAVAVDPGDRVADLAGAALWGLLRSAASEFPGRFAVVDTDDDPASAAALPAALATREPQLALRAGRLTVPRLARHTPAADPGAPPFGPGGTVLVTGGTGTLGALLARHLVTRHGVRHLRLVSRRGPRAPHAGELRDELTALGATVTVTACDLADPDATRELIAATAAARPLTAVVHAAGVLEDALITNLTPERLDAVLAAKADSALALHRATADLPDPPALVLFSSTTATLGTPGQANYAAANAFLDALAHHRPRTLSIGWGLWAEASGMTRHLGDAGIRRMERTGVAPLGTDHALALFDAAAGATSTDGPPHLIAARLSLGAFGDRDGDAAVPAVLRDLVRLPARRSAAAASADGDTLASRWAAMPPAEREREALLLVREQAAAVLGHGSAEPIEPGQTFKSLGFDSLTAVQLRNRLADVVGRRLPTTLAFDYPTPHALTTYLLGDDAAGARSDAALRPAGGGAGELADDPVVIVGMACRYPGGVASPEDLWRLVTEGREGLGPFPTDRGWDLDALFHPDQDRPGTSHTRAGHFLYRAGDFDPDLFGLSRREALAMDPQQRLLLETSWEAFERAGIDPAALRGSRTGVFTGLMYHDYAVGVDAGAEGVEGHVLTGTQASVASGRVSYAFGLEGPAVTVDTACSSSLVALHLAAQSLRTGECDMALAGGVTVMASPGTFVEFSRQRGLAPDGRCKSFAAGADGTGWAEGVGVLVVERLSAARRNGHRVLAVVRGSAVNQDGASNGLTAPNGPSQQRVIRAALDSAGLGLADVDAVEAHGTGTTLGDPIEAEALLSTYGRGRDEDSPLWLGSIKSNIGHAQAAAGVAGIIKMVHAMRHGELPATLHVDEPTPHVDWAAGGVSLLTDSRPWPEVDRPRRAAVSSFGVSGTNAHVILEQPELEAELPAAAAAGPVGVPLSAQGDAALSAYAATVRGHLVEHPELEPAAVAAALRTRARLSRHAVVVGEGRQELLAGLEALADGVPHPGVVTGRAGMPGGTVFVYPGQGSQWVGMGARLFAGSPVFADALTECARALAPHTEFDLLDVLTSDDPAALEPVEVVQPALWAVMVALTRWWEHHGVRPDAVIGHSQGEIAAAHVAGALSLEDAARVVAQRSQALTALAGTGGMLSVALDEAGADALFKDCGVSGDVSVAAVNGPTAVVVAGPAAALDAVQEHCARNEIRHRRIPVTYASHTPLVQPLEADLEARLSGIEPRTADIPFYSTVTAGSVDTTTLTSDYWFTNLRSPVRFHQTVQALLADGYGHFLEPSPHPGLLTAVEDTIDATDSDAVTHATLHRDDDTPHRLALALAHTHAHGLDAASATNAPPAELPTYPFQHEHLWLAPPRATRSTHDTLNSWRYTVTWRPHTPPAAPRAVLTGTWLLLTPPEASVPAALVAALEAAGAAVTTDPEHPDPAGILNLDPDPTATLTRLHDRQRRPAAPLWTVTTHAVRATPQDPPPDPDHARTWGLGRVAALEYVRHFAGLVDLPADPQPHHYARLVQHLADRTDPEHEPHVAIRDGGGHAPRLVRAPLTTPPPGAGYRPRHATLVTGGTGALGPHIARWLVEAGAEHLVLVSRRGGTADGVAELVAEVEEQGARVTVAACDVGDRDAVADLVRRLDADGVRVGTVIHAAAAMRLNSLDALTVEEFHEVVEAKVAGARHLDELLAHHPVEAFVLFSSIAGVWGSGDHGAYAAANAWLDAFAEQRRARGLPATSVAWGVWGSDTLPDAVDPEFLRRQGLPLLDPETALAGLRQALDHDETFVALADVDWERFLPVFTSARPSPLLAEIAAEQRPAADRAAAGPVREGSPLAQRLAGLAPEEREKELLAVVHSCLAAVLGQRPGAAEQADLTDKTPFRQRGMDSLLAVELRNRLGEATGLRLPATLVFEHPHPLAVARFLGGELAVELAGDPAGLPPAAAVRAELARLEAAVTAHGVGAQERTEVAARLRTLLAGLDTQAAPPPADAGEAAGGAAADDDLDLVSDEEMFDLIDRELREG